MIVDLFLVYQFIRRLATPFVKWDAYKLGIIDKDGKVLIKKKDLKTPEQKKAWGIFDIMVANLKKLLAKVPGGSSTIASYAAALYLIKEWNHFSEDSLLTEDITEEQLEESLLLFSSAYLNYTTLAENVNSLLTEKLKKSDSMGTWIKDFQDSDAPQFKGKSKEKKRQMAIAAKLDAERQDEACWDGYRQVGMKKKNGKEVPNCVPENKKINTKPELDEEPANNVGSGNIAGLDGSAFSKSAQKKWTSQNKSKKKTLRDIMGR